MGSLLLGAAVPVWSDAGVGMGSVLLAPEPGGVGSWTDGCWMDDAVAHRAGTGSKGRVDGKWKPPEKHPPAFQHLFCAEPLGLGVFMGISCCDPPLVSRTLGWVQEGVQAE